MLYTFFLFCFLLLCSNDENSVWGAGKLKKQKVKVCLFLVTISSSEFHCLFSEAEEEVWLPDVLLFGRRESTRKC